MDADRGGVLAIAVKEDDEDSAAMDLLDSLLTSLWDFLFLYGLPLWVSFFWAGCPCCGEVNCVVCVDDFNRSDSTDISAGSSCGWTETAGSWEISSNALKCTSANAKATCDTDAPFLSRAITVRVKGATNGDQGRVYIGSTAYAEIKFQGSGLASFLIGYGSTTLDTTGSVLTLAINTYYLVRVCYRDGFLSAEIDGISDSYVEANIPIVPSLSNALGTGNTVTSAVTFDDFELRKLNESCACPLEDAPTDCEICADTFNRSDSTNVNTGSPCGWTETAGDWSIASNALAVSSANAILTCGTNAPAASRLVRAKIKSSTANNLARLLVGNWKVEIKFSTTAGSLKIINSGGTTVGTSPTNLNIAIDTLYTVTACYDSDLHQIRAQVSGIDESFVTANGTITDLTSGLATGGTMSGTTTFDDFELLRNIMPDCPCPMTILCDGCEDGYGPDEFKVTVRYQDDHCSCAALNGTYYVNRDADDGCELLLPTGICGADSGTMCSWYLCGAAEGPSCWEVDECEPVSLDLRVDVCKIGGTTHTNVCAQFFNSAIGYCGYGLCGGWDGTASFDGDTPCLTELLTLRREGSPDIIWSCEATGSEIDIEAVA